jgi:hypothetical protein
MYVRHLYADDILVALRCIVNIANIIPFPPNEQGVLEQQEWLALLIDK